MTTISARLGVLVGLLTLLACGCAPRDISRQYGQRRGPVAGPSVNGTLVLSEMFESRGHRARSWTRLSPRLEDFQTIVWMPNEFAPPNAEARVFIEQWLSSAPERTFIYVGRDYDASIGYWTKMLEVGPPDQLMEISRRRATVQAEHDAARAVMPEDEAVDWFTLSTTKPRHIVESLDGPWADGIDASQVEIELNSRLEVPTPVQAKAWMDRDHYRFETAPRYTPLLQSGEEAIVTEVVGHEWANSRLIVVNNGSFLLNLPLVNHEHRKLAGKLLDLCSPGDVAFLESGPAGIGVFDEEPGSNYPTGFEVLTAWPIGIIVMHLTVLGILCCFAEFPIFGRPRETMASDEAGQTGVAEGEERMTTRQADFGQHISALGELLELTHDREYAWNKVQYYHEHIKSDATKRW